MYKRNNLISFTSERVESQKRHTYSVKYCFSFPQLGFVHVDVQTVANCTNEVEKLQSCDLLGVAAGIAQNTVLT